jgi:hypothetical protein
VQLAAPTGTTDARVTVERQLAAIPRNARGSRSSATTQFVGHVSNSAFEHAMTAHVIVDTDYERDKLRPNPDMIVRITKALAVSTDEPLGVKPQDSGGSIVSGRVIRHLVAIDGLPKRDKDALLRTIDAVLLARKAS